MLVVSVLWLAGCAATPAPEFPVEYANEAEVSALAGRWWGDYGSIESGRHGRVRFTLVADNKIEAAGDVLMIPHHVAESENVVERSQVAIPTSLQVRFVQIRGTTVMGALEPYKDPQCGCMVSTTFLGELDGDTIEGTYVSQGGRMHIGHSGRWAVERKVDEDPQPGDS